MSRSPKHIGSYIDSTNNTLVIESYNIGAFIRAITRVCAHDSSLLTSPANKHPHVVYGTHSHAADKICKWTMRSNLANHMTRLGSIFGIESFNFLKNHLYIKEMHNSNSLNNL